MIDTYKRVLVGQYEPADKREHADFLEDVRLRQTENAQGDAAGINPEALEYGTGQAEILEYYLTDDRDVRTTAVIKGSVFTLHMKVKFHAHVPGPIFAFTIKNALGTEITGTNSMIEKACLESGEPEQVKEITFTQKMSLQGGEYLLSLGVTGYNVDTFEV